MSHNTKKYKLPEHESQIVSEPVAAYALPQQPVMQVLKTDIFQETGQNEPFDLTKEQITQILDMSDMAFAQGKVYSHAEVMNRVRNYKYGHSLV